jgi:RND family efflux transporter MFP subunit
MNSRALARFHLLSICAALFVACQGCGPAMDSAPPAATHSVETPVADSTPQLDVRTPARKTLSRVTEQPGKIEAFEESLIYPRTAGHVERVLFDIGDHVTGPRYSDSGQLLTPGQALVELSVPAMHEDLAQKKALCAQAGAQLEQAQAQVKVAEAVVASSISQIEQAKTQEEGAVAEFERRMAEHGRVAELGRSAAVSQKVVDESKAQYRAAEAARRDATARVQSAKSTLVENEALVVKARTDEAAAAAAREVAAADLHRAQAQIDSATVRVPLDGVITARTVEIGQFVQPVTEAGATPLAVVVRADPLRVFVELPEDEAAFVDVGDPVTLRVPAVPGLTVESTIARTAWALNSTARTLRAEIDAPNADGKLRPGMSVAATIVLVSRPDVLTLPRAAIVRRDAQATCFVVRDGKAIATPISVGLEIGDDVEIITGLMADDQVVVAGAASLVDGQQVSTSTAAVKS